MSALEDDDLDLRTVPEWNLPNDRVGFERWLRENDITLDEFKGLPVWQLAPPDLVRQLEPVPGI